MHFLQFCGIKWLNQHSLPKQQTPVIPVQKPWFSTESVFHFRHFRPPSLCLHPNHNRRLDTSAFLPPRWSEPPWPHRWTQATPTLIKPLGVDTGIAWAPSIGINMGMLPKSARGIWTSFAFNTMTNIYIYICVCVCICIYIYTYNSCPNLETEQARAHEEGTGTQRKKNRQHPPKSSNIPHPPTCGLLMCQCWIYMDLWRFKASMSKTQNTSPVLGRTRPGAVRCDQGCTKRCIPTLPAPSRRSAEQQRWREIGLGDPNPRSCSLENPIRPPACPCKSLMVNWTTST